MRYLLYYAGLAVIFAAIDAVWLSVVANKFYKTHLGGLLRKKPLLAPAIVFYALYIVGLLVFALLPALETQDVWRGIGLGGLFGLIAYATYDLTNYATLKNWPLKVVVVDMLWGAAISAGSVGLALWLGQAVGL